MADDELQEILRTGIEAAQRGNKAIARRILEQVVDQDPANELAWIWMAAVVDSPEERQAALRRVLEINPENERARQALDKLERPAPRRQPRAPRAAAAPTPAVSTPPPLDFDREALLPAEESLPRRRRRSPLFFLIGLLAIGMIVAGVALLVNRLLSEDETVATPTSAAGLILVPTRPTQGPSFPTTTPLGGTLITLPPVETLPPTWTERPPATELPTRTPTATPPPLAGYSLLVSARRGSPAGWTLVTLRGDGSAEQPVTLRAPQAENGVELALLEALEAAYSPDGSQIAFTGRVRESRVSGDTTTATEFEEIFLVPAGGGTIRRLTTFQAANTGEATWAPGGDALAFASDADGDYDIYRLALEGGRDPAPLTINQDEDRMPAWSPDGAAIAFASDRAGPGDLEIWRMTASGDSAVQLTDDANSSYAPAWSPDGRQIAFISNRTVDADLYLMSADGSGERLMTVDDQGAEERDPAWSPDGEWIAFSSNRDSPVLELYLIRPNGSDLRRVTTERGDTRYAHWKP